MLFPPHSGLRENRVVITGVGIITAFGTGWEINAKGFRLGETAFRPITLFDASRQRVQIAAEVDLPAQMPDTFLTKRALSRADRASKILLLAAWEAWQQSGWEPQINLPVVLGTTSGGMRLGEDYFRQATAQPHRHHRQASRVIHYQSQRQPLDLADAFGFSGPITLIANACASGANAIGHAWEMVRSGQNERVLTGGYDALSHLVFSGFDSLQALSPTRCHPFDAQRNGLALGEGAAVVTLETLEAAQKRGAKILGEIVGYGAVTDSHHLTQPHPDGDAALASMNAALCVANLRPEQIDYINAHGTGTPLNDSAEASAINRFAGEHAKHLPVSSTKSSIGHLLGAAGAVEAVVCLMALQEQFLPPTNLATPDPLCRFPIVQKPTTARLDYAMTNSFGFGGANATLILRRWKNETPKISSPSKKSSAQSSMIFVNGIGAVSPAGWGMENFCRAMEEKPFIETKSLARPGWDKLLFIRQVPPPALRPDFLNHPRLRRTSPITHYGVAAALEALGENAAAVRAGKLRLGIVQCVMSGCINYSKRFYDETLRDPETASPVIFPETVFNAPASHLAALLGTPAINYTLNGDPGTFLQGVALAAEWLRGDKVDGCLVLGAEETDWLTADAFRRFQRKIILSGGAGAIFLSRERNSALAQLDHITDSYLFLAGQSRFCAAQKMRAELKDVSG
ncbi:MAG: beta-ketoacyl-[acyl-carrier-protein] synthase family protein, partial [Verrucomicrobiota bacterium]